MGAIVTQADCARLCSPVPTYHWPLWRVFVVRPAIDECGGFRALEEKEREEGKGKDKSVEWPRFALGM